MITEVRTKKLKTSASSVSLFHVIFFPSVPRGICVYVGRHDLLKSQSWEWCGPYHWSYTAPLLPKVRRGHRLPQTSVPRGTASWSCHFLHSTVEQSHILPSSRPWGLDRQRQPISNSVTPYRWIAISGPMWWEIYIYEIRKSGGSWRLTLVSQSSTEGRLCMVRVPTMRY